MIVISSYRQKYCSQTRAHKFILKLQMICAPFCQKLIHVQIFQLLALAAKALKDTLERHHKKAENVKNNKVLHLLPKPHVCVCLCVYIAFLLTPTIC